MIAIRFSVLTFLILTAAASFSYADKDRELALQQYEEAVNEANEPSSAAEESEFYARMQVEGQSLMDLNDSLEQAQLDDEAKKKKKPASESSKKELKNIRESVV